MRKWLLQPEQETDGEEANHEHDEHIVVLLQIAKRQRSYQVANHLATHIEGPKVSEEETLSALSSTV